MTTVKVQRPFELKWRTTKAELYWLVHDENLIEVILTRDATELSFRYIVGRLISYRKSRRKTKENHDYH
jgi:hypothetical protein